jgi:hypothetical protein
MLRQTQFRPFQVPSSGHAVDVADVAWHQQGAGYVPGQRVGYVNCQAVRRIPVAGDSKKRWPTAVLVLLPHQRPSARWLRVEL